MFFSPALVGIFFIAPGITFLGLAVVESLKKVRTSTPARKAWLRVGVIFTGVGLFLYVFHSFFRSRPR
jgi:hypothetical protein